MQDPILNRGVRACAILKTKLNRECYLPAGTLAALLTAAEFSELGIPTEIPPTEGYADIEALQDSELGKLLSAASRLPWVGTPCRGKSGPKVRKATYCITDEALTYELPEPAYNSLAAIFATKPEKEAAHPVAE